MDFPAIPLMPGPWRPLLPGHAAGFVRRLQAMLDAPLTHDGLQPQHALGSLRAMPLSFYPGWALIEGEATVEAGVIGTFDVLYGPGLMWLIDGEARVLNALNSGMVPEDVHAYAETGAATGAPIPSPLVELDPQRLGPDFIRFYCACVWGEEGPFTPVESLQSPLLRNVDTSGERWVDDIRPITAVREDDALVAEGVIAYGNSLFHARLCVRDGSVTMEDDQALASGILPERRHRSPLRDLRAADPTRASAPQE